MKAVLFGCCLVLATVPVSIAQCISSNDKVVTNEIDSSVASQGQQRFSMEMLKILNQMNPKKNIFFSPHSVYQSVLLSYIIAANNTEAAIQKAMFIPSTQSKLSTVQSYGMEKYFQKTREYNGSTDYTYVTANKIYLDKEVMAKQCMLDLLKDEVEMVDFKSNPNTARQQINTWVENLTKNNIKDLINEHMVNSDTKLILANAAYFKGLWQSRFQLQSTKKNALFYVSKDVITHVDMMRQKGTFNTMVSEALKANVLELPYKGDAITMIILLPRFETNAIDRLIKQITEENLREILEFSAFYQRPVEVLIPKFTVEQEIDLKPVLFQMGLEELFNDTADFSTLTGSNEIHFGGAVHKAKVEVDEEGTTAAAATAIFTFRSSRPLEPTRFEANHPFVYFLYDKMSQNIIFMGVYRVPEKKITSATTV